MLSNVCRAKPLHTFKHSKPFQTCIHCVHLCLVGLFEPARNVYPRFLSSRDSRVHFEFTPSRSSGARSAETHTRAAKLFLRFGRLKEACPGKVRGQSRCHNLQNKADHFASCRTMQNVLRFAHSFKYFEF